MYKQRHEQKKHIIHITKPIKNHGGNYFMSLSSGKRLHIYGWTELPIDNDVIEQVKQFYSYEKVPLVKDKYPRFEWVPGIPILYETQEEVPYVINEYEIDVEDVGINDDDNGQEEYEDEQGLNTTEENQYPENEEGIYIT